MNAARSRFPRRRRIVRVGSRLDRALIRIAELERELRHARALIDSGIEAQAGAEAEKREAQSREGAAVSLVRTVLRDEKWTLFDVAVSIGRTLFRPVGMRNA